MSRAKDAMTGLLRDLGTVRGFAEALHGVRLLPSPTYDEDAWAFVAATLSLLPEVAAHLEAVFAERKRADFTEAMLRTLAALGDPERPGELLLDVDYRVSHLLVDEFQDTSLTQLELIERLTSGFNPEERRTVFAVGDPMQSIYRFREAEVGIFLDAQAQNRIADLPVTSLGLARNFRSSRAIIDWVNRTFSQVLPAASDALRGAVAYSPVAPAPDAEDGTPPSLTLCPNRVAEAAAVVRYTRAALEAHARDVGILVRARTHLDAILPALRDAGIPFAAVEIESLEQRLATRDLISLTRVLTQPADRGAVFALLRAPWCGLTLADLVALSVATDPTLVEALSNADVVSTLSTDGQRRIACVSATLAPLLAARGRMSLARRVRAAWLGLGGPACVDPQVDLPGAERFFALLGEHERAGDLPDFDGFVTAARALFAAEEAPPRGGVQVMTLHKAKGLEFDTVILPGLDRTTGSDDAPALRWRQRRRDDQSTLVIAPTRARSGAASDDDPVYAFLKALDAAEEDAELGRLLYVGGTRAERRLHLCAVLNPARDESGPPKWSKPASKSALGKLWPAIASMAPQPKIADGNLAPREDDAPPRASPLRRRVAHWDAPPYPARLPMVATPRASMKEVAFDWAHATAAAIGVVAHRVLADFARDGIASWNSDRVVAQRARFAAELARENVPPSELDTAVAAVTLALTRTLADERGRWLFDPAHEDAQSEWPLAGLDAGEIAHIVIDRTFVSRGERWIVDFKTGQHQGADRAAFLAREAERYGPQLARYARVVKNVDRRPIRLALYYPLIDDGFCELSSRPLQGTLDFAS